MRIHFHMSNRLFLFIHSFVIHFFIILQKKGTSSRKDDVPKAGVTVATGVARNVAKVQEESNRKAQSMDAMARQKAALHERNKGNDYFRAGEYENAILCYTASLELDRGHWSQECNPPLENTSTSLSEISKVYANRAQARLKAQHWEGAEQDATQALRADLNNIKALVRRGTARLKRGRYAMALVDLHIAKRWLQETDTKANVKDIKTMIRDAEKKCADLNIPLPNQETIPKFGTVELLHYDPNTSSMKSTKETVAAAPATRRRIVIEEDSEEEDEEEAVEEIVIREASTITKPKVAVEVLSSTEVPEESSESSKVRSNVLKGTSDEATPLSSQQKQEVSTAQKKESAKVAQGGVNESTADISVQAESLRLSGNQAMAAGDTTTAIAHWTRALDILPSDSNVPQDVRLQRFSVLANLAAGHMSLSAWQKTLETASAALATVGVEDTILHAIAPLATPALAVPGVSEAQQSENLDKLYATVPSASALSTVVKCLWRRSRAWNGMENWRLSLIDLSVIIALEPSNEKASDELKRVTSLWNAQQQKERQAAKTIYYSEAMGKQKEQTVSEAGTEAVSAQGSDVAVVAEGEKSSTPSSVPFVVAEEIPKPVVTASKEKTVSSASPRNYTRMRIVEESSDEEEVAPSGEGEARRTQMKPEGIPGEEAADSKTQIRGPSIQESSAFEGEMSSPSEASAMFTPTKQATSKATSAPTASTPLTPSAASPAASTASKKLSVLERAKAAARLAAEKAPTATTASPNTAAPSPLRSAMIPGTKLSSPTPSAMAGPGVAVADGATGPRTLFELETVCNSLRQKGSALAAFVRSLPSNFLKTIPRRPMEMSLFSLLVAALSSPSLHDSFGGGPADLEHAVWTIEFLEALLGYSGVSTLVMMLEPKESAPLVTALSEIESKHPSLRTRAAAIRKSL